MTGVSLMAMGGLVGAIIGIIWSDPHRNSMGRYTTHRRGWQNWVLQASLGGIMGALLTPLVMQFVTQNPIAIVILAVATYFIYTGFVDPR